MPLKVFETFYSLQGETTRAGYPSFFIRLAGCNLACAYCDTPGARSGGFETSVDPLLDELGLYPSSHHVTITGGEPLLQEEVYILIARLLEKKHKVQIETNGSIPLDRLPPEVRKIVDVKTPSSGEAGSFRMENLGLIGPDDELKFVISDDIDYRFSADFVKKNLEKCAATANFSPVYAAMDMTRLAGLILDDGLRVRLNLQLHKILWPRGERG